MQVRWDQLSSKDDFWPLIKSKTTCRILDTRAACWSAELQIATTSSEFWREMIVRYLGYLSGLIRAVSIGGTNQMLAVAQSHGTVSVLDPRKGRIESRALGNYTHASGVSFDLYRLICC